MTRINVDLSELLAPIKQMREEIQKMNDALRQTVQLQAQMAAHQRQSVNAYGPTKSGTALQIRDMIVARGGLSNVYDIGSGSPIPPSNINPTGSPLGSHLPGGIQIHRSYLGAKTILSQGGVGIAQAFASQAGLQNDLAIKKEREESIKLLSNSSNTTAKILLDVSKRIEQERTTASDTLKKATEAYGKAAETNSKDLAKFAKELDEAAKKFNKLNQKAEQFSETLDDFIKQGGPGGPGGGPPKPPPSLMDLWGNLSRGEKLSGTFGALASISGIALKGYGEYQGLKALGMEQDVSVRANLARDITTFNQYKYQEYMAQAAPTSGEQFVRTFGNLLTPGKQTFKFLGITNKNRLQEEASKYVELERKAEKARTTEEFSKGVGETLLGVGGTALGAFLMSEGGKTLIKTQLAKMAAKTAGTALIGSAIGTAVPVLGNIIGGTIGTAVGGGIGTVSAIYSGYQAYNVFKTSQQRAATTRTGLEGGGTIFANERELAIAGQQVAKNAEIEQAKEQYRQQELSSFAARKLAMGIDENLAALRMQTAATAMAGGAAVTGFEVFGGISDQKAKQISDRYATLGYSIPEVGQIYNTYAGMMGTTRGADRLLALSRAGVGSVEQMASNVLGISAVSGKQGDTKQLENIFAKAFEAGLKGAPAIQRFSQAAMEMSSALKLQSATGAANILSAVTAGMAGRTGSPLMSLEEAKTGISALAATTGARTGLMGTLKVLSAASMGAGLGTSGLMSGSNLIQVQEAMSQLSKPVEDYTQLTGLARQLVGVQIRAGLTPQQAIRKVRDMLQAQSGAQIAPFAAGYKQVTGKDFSTVQAEARNLLKAGRAEDLRNLLAQFKGETVGIVGLEAEGAAESLLLSGLAPADARRGQKILAQEKAKGAAKAAADFSTVQYKKILNEAAKDAAKGINRTVSEEELLKVAKELGVEGNATKQIEELRKAAGIGAKDDFTFSKLSGAISVLADKEGGVGGRVSIVEDFGDAAIQKLASALRGTPMPEEDAKEFSRAPGPNAPITPSNSKKQNK